MRTAGASLALLAALGWLGDRVGWSNPVGALADSLSRVGPWALLGLALLALASTALLRKGHTPASG